MLAGIEDAVRLVRFPGWQGTKQGEREMQKALRKVVYVDYKIRDGDLLAGARPSLAQHVTAHEDGPGRR